MVPPAFTMSPHIVDCGAAAVNVGEGLESVGADRDAVMEATKAMSDRRMLAQRGATGDFKACIYATSGQANE